MSSEVIFELHNAHFEFESGEATFYRIVTDPPEAAGISALDGSMTSLHQLEKGILPAPTYKLSNGRVEAVTVAAAGPFYALLRNAQVRASGSGRRFEVAAVPIAGDVTERDLQRGRSVVELDHRVLIVIRVEDASGRPLPGAQVSVNESLEVSTLEVLADDRGEVTILGRPSRYHVRAGTTPARTVDFEITNSDSGQRVIVVR